MAMPKEMWLFNLAKWSCKHYEKAQAQMFSSRPKSSSCFSFCFSWG